MPISLRTAATALVILVKTQGAHAHDSPKGRQLNYEVLSVSKLPTVISNYIHVVSVILKVVCVVLKAVFIDHSEGCLDFCGYSYIILY